MSVASHPFHTLPVQALLGNVKFPGDTIKCALFSTAPTLTTTSFSSLTGEITGTGYTAGGVALASLTATETEANSWATVAATTTAYSADTVVIPSGGNGFLYVCVVGGTSGGSAPSWPTTTGQTVTDGTVTWSNIGTSITVFSSASASWTTATITASYGVIYDSTTAANIVMLDFGGAQSASGGTFTISPPVTGWFWNAGN